MARQTTRRAERTADELRQVFGALLRRLRVESADSELSPSEQRVLKRLLEQGPSTTAALARAEWVKPQSMGATLAGLEERGLVDRAVDATDGRRRTISITDEGQRAFLEVRTARQSWLARAIDQSLDAQEQRALSDALELLRRVVES